MINFWHNRLRRKRHKDIQKAEAALMNPKMFRVLEQYPDTFSIKTINRDIVNTKEANICIVPINSYLNCSFSEDLLETVKEDCRWGLDNNMKVFIDDSYEMGSPFDLKGGAHLFLKDFFISNNIKVICSAPDLYSNFTWRDDLDDKWSIDPNWNKVFLNFDMFYYYTRQQYQLINREWSWNTYPTIHQHKKYLFSTLIGDVLKRRNASFLGALFFNDLIDADCFYSAINKSNYMPQEYWFGVESEVNKNIIDYINKNKEKIFKHYPFERNYPELCEDDGKARDEERRIAQEIYDSHFVVNVETTDHPFFFTEKTFKNIISDSPFITFGGPYFSEGLKIHHGFEKFEEIFDYSHEDYSNNKRHADQVIYGIIDNIKRLKKEPVSIFNQPSVKEKVEYNKYIYFKNSTKNCLLEALERLFLS